MATKSGGIKGARKNYVRKAPAVGTNDVRTKSGKGDVGKATQPKYTKRVTGSGSA